MTDEYAAGLESARAAERTWLRGPTSVLAATARHDLPIGTTVRFGPSATADVTLPGIAREFAVVATTDGFVVDGEVSGPRTVEAGRYHLRLSHQNYPAAVVLDAESPRLRDDVELRWFPVDPRLRLRTTLEPDRAARALGSTASAERTAERMGWVSLTIEGTRVRLAVDRMLEPGVPADHLEIYFRDATTGRESYAVGRYVTLEHDGEDLVVDFNRAYSPACSLSPFYNCPIPPRENHLSIPIRAGEMTPLEGPTAAHL